MTVGRWLQYALGWLTMVAARGLALSAVVYVLYVLLRAQREHAGPWPWE